MKFKLKEWHRTVILLLLLALAVGFIIWSNNQYSVNFVESF
jgi:hypothetical protein